ncbi:uncharacterized protein [Tursiops truncatus]|uniref:uncharacterized protein n=1 Tax=Tursiops truncatus TaxID=9739 RepID=UPI003CCF982B
MYSYNVLRTKEGSGIAQTALNLIIAILFGGGHQAQAGEKPHGSPDSRHQGNRPGEKKVRGRQPPAPRRAKEQPDSSRAGLHRRGGSAHTPWRLHGRRTRSRSRAWVRSWGRCQHSPAEAGPPSRKRRCGTLGPEARAPLAALTSHLYNQMGALEVVLGELRAPGGAFLPLSTGRTEPTAAQRAWLAWQLAHVGAALHWALAALDSLLAARSGPAGS